MTRASRIAAEIMNGGPALVRETLAELSKLDGWRTDEPPEVLDTEVIVQAQHRYSFVPYANEHVCKSRGAPGRWVRRNDDGTYTTAPLPNNKQWKQV